MSLQMLLYVQQLLSKCVSTGVHTYWRTLHLLCAAFYINVTAGMPEYRVKLECWWRALINCYMHVWSNYNNMSIERSHTLLHQLTNCSLSLCNQRDYLCSLSLRTCFEVDTITRQHQLMSSISTEYGHRYFDSSTLSSSSRAHRFWSHIYPIRFYSIKKIWNK